MNKKLKEALEKVVSGLEPVIFDEDLNQTEMEDVFKKNPQQIISEDGYTLWKNADVWTDGDMEFTEEEIIQKTLNGDMTWIINYRATERGLEHLEGLLEDGVIEEPRWYKRRI